MRPAKRWICSAHAGRRCDCCTVGCRFWATAWTGDSLAYCTDVSSFPPETYALLEDLDVLVIDGLRYRHHPTHMTVEQALGVIEEVQPRRAYLTHMAHDIRHAELEKELPEGVTLGYDGLSIEVDS